MDDVTLPPVLEKESWLAWNPLACTLDLLLSVDLSNEVESWIPAIPLDLDGMCWAELRAPISPVLPDVLLL